MDATDWTFDPVVVDELPDVEDAFEGEGEDLDARAPPWPPLEDDPPEDEDEPDEPPEDEDEPDEPPEDEDEPDDELEDELFPLPLDPVRAKLFTSSCSRE